MERDTNKLPEPVKTDNELIAEFMGLKLNTEIAPFNDYHIVVDGRDYWVPEFNLPYKTMWSALMPVVEKIESLGYCTCIYPKHCDISVKGTIIEAKRGETKIHATYEAVTVFIKWYNTQTK